MEESHAGADRQSILQFMTTEHFTLQTARAVANAEITSRLQLYLGTLSSSIIALALTAQLSGLGVAFRAFALVLLPVVFFLGVVTHGRLLQVNAEWRLYGQGMNRIRHYFLELAPEMERYFVLPASDDPWVTLAAIGVRTGGNPWQALLTAGSMIVVVNSVLAGVFAAAVAQRRRAVGAAGWPWPRRWASWSAWLARASMDSGRSAATSRPPRWSSLPDPLAVGTADRVGRGQAARPSALLRRRIT